MTERVADRRSIIGGGAWLASAGALALPARARAADAAGHWQPATETQDDWMDKPGTRHRLMFDTTAPAAVASAIFYANTYYAANKRGYGQDPQQLGLRIVMRHIATPFGYNEAIGAAHGALFAGAIKREGAQANRAN